MKAELYAAAVQYVMAMMHIWHVFSCLGLIVKLPMLLEVGNQGTIDLCNNWSVVGWTRHIIIKVKHYYYLHELKKVGLLKVKWKSGDAIADKWPLSKKSIKIIIIWEAWRKQVVLWKGSTVPYRALLLMKREKDKDKPNIWNQFPYVQRIDRIQTVLAITYQWLMMSTCF